MTELSTTYLNPSEGEDVVSTNVRGIVSVLNEKILAIGDIHQAPNIDQIEATIAREDPDRIVFLGDYFDQWHDHPDHAARTARWLKQSLADPKRVHLMGNHDLHYLWPEAACSGFTWDKHRFIQNVLTASDWTKLKLWHHE